MPAPFSREPDQDIVESSPRWGRAISLLERVPRWVMSLAVVALLAGGGAVLGVDYGGPAAPAPARPVANAIWGPGQCGQWVNLTSKHVASGFRVLLGDVAMPPAFLPLQTSGRGAPWEFGIKTGIMYRGDGPPVTISVPEGWQNQMGMFGPPDTPTGVASTLHIPSCPPRGSWDVYVTAFYSSTPYACAPLDVRVGRLTAEVWFGLGDRCPAGVSTGPVIPATRVSTAP